MRSLTASLVLFALGLATTGCQSRLDKDKIDAMTKTMFADQLKLKAKTVKCPDDMDAKKGSKFECTVDLDPSGTVPVDLEVTDDSGTVSVATKYKVITPDALTSEITKGLAQQEIKAEVDCGKEIQLAKPGATWKCTAKQDGKPTPIVVTVGPDGGINWKAQPE